MTKCVFWLFAIGLLCGAEPPGDAAKKDLDRMQGEWRVEKAVRRGKDAPAAVRDKLSIAISGSTITINDSTEAREEKAEITLDPSKTPANIDAVPTLPGSDRVLGIYKLEGDNLTICWNKGDGPRPGAFEIKPGTDVVLLVLKRAKK